MSDYEIQLQAWHSAFGTTQLSHAVAERDQLKAELAQARAHNAALLEACKAAHSALDMLMGDSDLDDDESPEMKACQLLASAIAGKTGLSEAEKDKARLDWLEKQLPTSRLFDWSLSPLDDGGFIPHPLSAESPPYFGNHYRTVRAAIDAAIALEKGEKS